LAQASVDWASGALASDDWAVREAAAGTIGDMPEEKAAPLLAQAIADPDPKVRRAAARSASKMKTPQAARKLAAAIRSERDPKVKEEEVKALGAIGSAEVQPLLEEIARQDGGRLGVIAAGSLV